jgi:integrase
MRLAITLGARAGVRRSEALGLTVDRSDRERCTVTVDRLAGQRGAPFVFAPLKTAASHRVVPVAPETIDDLPEVVEGELGLVLALDGPSWADTVFGSAWTQLARGTKLPYSFHDLRHYFCSTLLAEGINPKAVAKVAGHSAAVVTLQTYAHA